MATIEIQEGETEKIIPDDQANREYILEVSGATVAVGHSNKYARDGTEIQPGDRVAMGNLRNDSMFAYAVDGNATIQIDQAAADIQYMARATSNNLSQLETVNTVQELETITGTVDVAGNVTVDDILATINSDVSDRSGRNIGKSRLMNSTEVLINPATEEKQDEMITLLEQIEENTRS